MYKMNFHWEKGDKTGQFSVTAYEVEECLKIAEETVKEDNAELVDWYVV